MKRVSARVFWVLDFWSRGWNSGSLLYGWNSGSLLYGLLVIQNKIRPGLIIPSWIEQSFQNSEGRGGSIITCSSIIGFQSESKMMTVSAVWRFTPCPPARVDRRNTKISEFGTLNSSIIFALSSLLVDPTSLRYMYPLDMTYSSRISSS
jgi:hypothetical protein